MKTIYPNVQQNILPGVKENDQQEQLSVNTHKETFLEKIFFGPHRVEGEEISEEENETVMQQLVWWSRME